MQDRIKHFYEVSLRKRRENSETEGQIHLYEVSLRERRETSER